MKRRKFITLLGGAAAAWPGAAYGQQDERIRALQHRILRLQAEVAAKEVDQFIEGIKSQVGWTTQLPWSAGTIEARRFDGLRLMRQVPSIYQLSQLDGTGKERLRITRLVAQDVVDSGADFSKDPKFTEAVANKVYYGPVYFLRGCCPYMTLSLAGTRRDAGVSVAEVSLKVFEEVIAEIKIGQNGHAYAVDAQGRLIAHPDKELVLRDTDMSKLAHVRAALGGTKESAQEGEDILGRKVLTAYAPIPASGWIVLVEVPVEEVNLIGQDESKSRPPIVPIYRSIVR